MNSTASTPLVTLIPGDGVGPECVRSAQAILAASGARLDWEECHAGASVFRKGVASGVPRETIDSIARTRLALKGPLETPVGYGEKSANVTLRKLFETFANLRPVREFPNVPTPYQGRGIDLVVVRENVEDLYAGIEHMQTGNVAQCLKLISRPGCEKIVRLAFEFARSEGRKSVHCATKANIMKLTEGLLKRTFEAIAPEYPDIQANHIIVDNCAHQLVKKPEQFEVIVTTNMNGDILSDLTSALVGGLGFAPSANLGREVAIFEAVHGSAPKYAGKDCINPTAVVLSGAMMLRHLGQFEAAARVEHGVRAALAAGVRTRDVSGDAGAVSTTKFTEAVVRHMESFTASTNNVRKYQALRMPPAPPTATVGPRRTVGADIFIESTRTPAELGKALEEIAAGGPLKLKMVSNRGTQVYPATGGTPDCVDHFRCRFVAAGATDLNQEHLLHLVGQVGLRFRWMHVEVLQEIGGEPGYTRAQGED